MNSPISRTQGYFSSKALNASLNIESGFAVELPDIPFESNALIKNETLYAIYWLKLK